MNFLFYLAAFLVALGVLIFIHESGHFWVARWCGVKVLRFSLGFGKPILMRRFGKDQTEMALGAIPLGGYVKMLDEREGPVASEELHRAFNRQVVWKRFAIVAAGPIANFLLAIFFYWVLFVHGVEELRPVLGAPTAASAADKAGIQEGEVIRNVNGEVIETWQEFRWAFLKNLVDKEQPNSEGKSGQVLIETLNPSNEINVRRVDISGVDTKDLDRDVIEHMGLQLFRPKMEPILGSITPGSVAEAVGLRAGDRIVSVDGEPTPGWGKVVALISKAPGRQLMLTFERGGSQSTVSVVPADVKENGRHIGRLGMGVKDDGMARTAMFTMVSYGPLESLRKAAQKTWETSVYSLKMIGRMITGQLSLKNISGPVTIADFAGQSASLGLSRYLDFLAMISISLGVLNLLPIPLLDGGHLMYYIVEIIKGSPVSERLMGIGQQIGLAFLAMLMIFAFYNDINRLISG